MNKQQRLGAATIGVVLTCTLAAVGTAFGTLPGASAATATATTSSSAATTGSLVIVQAVPGTRLSVTVDGAALGDDLAVGDVVGPLRLDQGEHDIVFTDESGGVDVMTTASVVSGTSSDVVLHRPATVGGDPVVNVYATPSDPIGPGKARVLLAHTATTAPADVQVDGQVVFTNIANGEYAEADVPAGQHQVALLPSGVDGDPILGPLDLGLKAGTVTMVYAVGDPLKRSMDVIVRVNDLSADGSVAPDRIETGSAGYAADLDVVAFSPFSRVE